MRDRQLSTSLRKLTCPVSRSASHFSHFLLDGHDVARKLGNRLFRLTGHRVAEQVHEPVQGHFIEARRQRHVRRRRCPAVGSKALVFDRPQGRRHLLETLVLAQHLRQLASDGLFLRLFGFGRRTGQQRPRLEVDRFAPIETKSDRASRFICSHECSCTRYWSVTWTRETVVMSSSSFSIRWRRRSRGPSK